jgi:cytochrome bd-type quinol oxidase subunit 2
MIQTIKKFITNSVLAGLFLVPVMAPAAVYAADDIQSGLCAGVNLNVSDSANCNPNSGDAEGKVNGLIKLVINIFSLVVGVVAVIMIIIGGLKYITSSGDSNNITSAKNTILYAIIGLVVVALAQFIVKFVLSKATGAGN